MNSTTILPPTLVEDVPDDDATWILTSVFIIFTMQSGFGLLESGIVQRKNEGNIMMKNAMDVIFGGISYWFLGYGLSYGPPNKNNPFCGEGNFLVQFDGPGMGTLYANYIFQLSFATTATTIVSGGMAERVNLTAYIVFSFFNTFVYVIPAHWMWGEKGWLKDFGALDFAGSGVVHLTGGMSALIAAIILGPRKGRYDNGPEAPQMGNANQSLLGMFMLWWGWLGFNCGSSFGIAGGKWVIAAKAGVTTINAAIAGGAIGTIYSFVLRKGVFSVADLINGVLGALVGITAGCAMVQPWEALVIGAIGGLLAIVTPPVLDRLKVDDPVGAFAVHGISGIWGLLSVGFFADVDTVADVTGGQRGVFHGGGGQLLLSQFVASLGILAWSGVVSFLLLISLHAIIGIRMSEEEEEIGADYVEHDILPPTGIPRYPSGVPVIKRGWACTRCTRRGADNLEMIEGQNNAGFDGSLNSAATKM